MQVRSLTLDKWSKSLMIMMEKVGNERFNRIWEAAVPPGRSKPGVNATREEREAWIRDKYIKRRFIEPWDGENPSALLYEAARTGDLEKTMWAVAHGGDPNWVNSSSPTAKGRTAMHAVCEGANPVCLELLFQNGGNLDVSDFEEVTPLELAMKSSNSKLISFVLKKVEGEE